MFRESCDVLFVEFASFGNSFAECQVGHSAKTSSPSPGAVMTAFLCRVPEKKYSAKKALPMHYVLSPLC
jgi:hypothetical protein